MEEVKPEDIIKEAREAKGYTQQQMADLLHIGIRSYQHIEGGRFPINFYALKYVHTSQVAKLKGEEIAAGHDGHTTSAMVRNIYFHDREEELHKEMKDLGNTLTGT